MVRKTCFRRGNRYLGGRIVEILPDDGENMTGGMVVRLPRVKMCFLTFWVENVEIPTQSATFGYVAKMMKLVRKITFSVRKVVFVYIFC